jgi:hypothetical protein
MMFLAVIYKDRVREIVQKSLADYVLHAAVSNVVTEFLRMPFLYRFRRCKKTGRKTRRR